MATIAAQLDPVFQWDPDARAENGIRRVHLTRQTTEAGSQCPRCHVTGQVAQRQPTGIVTIILIVAACAATAVAWLTRQREDVAVLRVAVTLLVLAPMFWLRRVRSRGTCNACGASFERREKPG
jgi:hypothetical protein